MIYIGHRRRRPSPARSSQRDAPRAKPPVLTLHTVRDTPPTRATASPSALAGPRPGGLVCGGRPIGDFSLSLFHESSQFHPQIFKGKILQIGNKRPINAQNSLTAKTNEKNKRKPKEFEIWEIPLVIFGLVVDPLVFATDFFSMVVLNLLRSRRLDDCL
jgi:hypothetical protein